MNGHGYQTTKEDSNEYDIPTQMGGSSWIKLDQVHSSYHSRNGSWQLFGHTQKPDLVLSHLGLFVVGAVDKHTNDRADDQQQR